LELSKPIFISGTQSEQDETRRTLAHVIESALRALHPYIPFITEELWQRVPRPSKHPLSIALASYPTADDGRLDVAAEQEMALITEVIGAARTIRSEHEVHPAAQVPLHLRAADTGKLALLKREQVFIKTLVKTDGDPRIEAPGGERPRGSVLSLASDVEVIVALRGLVDPAKESERIERGLKKIAKDSEGLAKRLNNAAFVSKAPPEVVKEAQEQLEALGRQKQRLEEARSLVSELQAD
jgi:valyl-tRNA synthetase